LVKRGGWKEQPPIPEAEVAQHLEALDKPVAPGGGQEIPSHVKAWDPTRGEYDWFDPHTGAEHKNREDRLDEFQKGPDYTFTDNHHEARRLYPVGDPEDLEEEEREEGMKKIDAYPPYQDLFGRELSHHLRSHLKTRLLEGYLASREFGSITDLLRAIVDGPNWKLVREAADHLDALLPASTPTRGGEARTSDRPGYAYLGPVTLESDGRGKGTIRMEGIAWDTLDPQDSLPLTNCPTLQERLGLKDDCERKQCILLSAVAAALWAKAQGTPPTMADIWTHTLTARAEQLDQAIRAEESLGVSEPRLPVGEADLRIFVHDAVAPHHDKDYRTLIVFPLTILEDLILHVLMIDYGGKVTVHELRGRKAGDDSPQAWMFIHRAHARALHPPGGWFKVGKHGNRPDLPSLQKDLLR